MKNNNPSTAIFY